jgi:hypothetical protein
MGNHPVAVMQEKQHLVIPVVRAERPTMAEDYRLSFTPVLVVNLYTVFGRDSWHDVSNLLLVLCRIAARNTSPDELFLYYHQELSRPYPF